MKSIILQSLFSKKSSVFLSRLAYSDVNVDLSYEQLASKIWAISNYIQKEKVVTGQKVLIVEKDPAIALIILLALIHAKAEIVIVAGVAVTTVIEKEQPVLIIENGDVLLSNILKNEVDTNGFRASGVNKADIHFSIYTPEQPEGIVYSAGSLDNAFAELSKGIAPIETDKYLIADHLSFVAFVIESLWCLLNGIHILNFPENRGNINELRPNAEEFVMDFSLFFFGSTKDNADAEGCYDLLMNSVKHADKHDYSGVWTPERHFNEFGGRFPNPSVLSAAIAVATEKVQIRTGSIVAPLHHVVRIAEDWSIIDNLSGGRTALSFASGWQCNDFIFAPENYANRHEVMLNQIAQFHKLWAGEQLPFKNGVGDEVKLGIFPRPVQKEMPIWITVSGKEETFVDAGRIGANILTHLLWQDPSDLISKIEVYRRSLKDNGFDPASRIVSVMVHTYVGKSSEEVRKIVEVPLKAYIRSSLHLVETMTAAVRNTNGNNAIGRYGKNDEQMPEHIKEELLDIAFERFFSNASLLGDKQQCEKTLKRLRSYGVDEVACLIDFGLEDATILEGLEELNNLKTKYRSAAKKRYPGSFTLRASAQLLTSLYKRTGPSIEGCKKVVTDKLEEHEFSIAFQDQVNVKYNLQRHNPMVTAEEDTSFTKMKTKLYEFNLEQASERIEEDF
jgi:natural product biosynthesis luciferase-like monooxygenase protein